jgi:hypothetical protein
MFVTPDVLFSALINQSWDTVACKDRSQRFSIGELQPSYYTRSSWPPLTCVSSQKTKHMPFGHGQISQRPLSLLQSLHSSSTPPQTYFEADGTGTAAQNLVPFKRTYKYRVFLSSLSWAWRLSRNVPVDAVSYCNLWTVRLYHIFPHYIIQGTQFLEKVFERKKCVSVFSTTFVRKYLTLNFILIKFK